MTDWNNTSINSYLKKLPLFSDFKDAAINEIVNKASLKNLNEGEVLIDKDSLDVQEDFYLLLEGKVEATQKANHKTYVLNEVGDPGIFLGESIFFNQEHRLVSIRSKTKSKVLAISSQLINRLLKESLDSGILIRFYQSLHFQTVSFLKNANEINVKLLKKQKNAGLFIINIVCFLSVFSVVIPYLQRLLPLGSNAQWVTVPLLAIGTLLLVVRLMATKTPLASVGISKINLKKSIIESIYVSIAVISLILFIKILLINLVPAFSDKQLFYSLKAEKLDLYGISLSNWDVFQYASIYTIHAFFQEVLARGALQGMFKEFFDYKYTNLYSILLASLVFACSHAYFGAVAVMAVFIPGLIWGWLYSRYGNIFGPFISHVIIGLIFIYFIRF